MKKSLEQYHQMPVSKAVLQNALPAVLAMLMTLIYNLADTFFIGQTGDAYKVAAVSLATPVFLIFMSVGTIFGVGGTSVISRDFGEGEKEHAGRVCAFCMWSCIGIGVLITALMLLFMNPLLRVIGAGEGTLTYTEHYLVIVSFSGTFSLISSCFSNVIRAEGQANRAMAGQLAGNLLNMCLDPLFISGFHWGVEGCALATLIGEAAGGIYYLSYYFRGHSSLSISIHDFTLRPEVSAGVLGIGIPAALGSILMSFSQIIMNALMAGYGALQVAGIGVAMKVVMITGMISMGIGQGVQPLLGYCVGAGDGKRFRKYMRFSVLFATALGVILTLFCYRFVEPITRAFLSDESAFDYAVSFAKILLCTGPVFGIYYTVLNALQAMGAAGSSLLLNVSRQGIVYIPCLLIFRAVFGQNGLVLAQPAADVVSLILGLSLYRRNARKMMRVKEESLTKA